MRHKTLSSRENFLYREMFLFGSDVESLIELTPGIHTFDFSFDLPNNVPGSFTSDIGNILYSIEGMLITETYYSAKVNLEVVERMIMEEKPLNVEESKSFRNVIFKSQPLVVAASLPKNNYGSGEVVEVNINISNRSDVEIKSVVLSLVEQANFKSQEPYVREKTVSSVLEKKLCDKGIEDKMQISFTLPELQCVRNNKIINVSYELHVNFNMEGFHSFPVLKFSLNCN